MKLPGGVPERVRLNDPQAIMEEEPQSVQTVPVFAPAKWRLGLVQRSCPRCTEDRGAAREMSDNGPGASRIAICSHCIHRSA